MIHSLEFFQNIFEKLSSKQPEMIVGRWYVQLAAIFAIVDLYTVGCFCLFLFCCYFLSILSPSGMDKLDGIVDDTSMS